jgi:hypothetical protein
MSQVSYHIAGGLSEGQIQRIHDEATGLIQRTGLRIVHTPTLRHVANFDGSHLRERWSDFDRTR